MIRFTWQVDILLFELQEVQDCGDNLSVLDNSKVFELEEGSQVLWTFSDAFLQLVELPLRNFILSELLIFDLVVLGSCLS